MNEAQGTAQLLALLGVSNVLGFFLVLARLTPLFIVAPVFSSRQVPARAKGIVALALALGLAPLATAGQELPTEVAAIVALIVKELLVGLAFALCVALLFAAIETAGALLDFLMGFAFGAAVDPVTGNQSAVISRFYAMIALGIFIAINGDAWLIQGMARTFDLVPLASAPDLGAIGANVVGAFTGVFAAALEVAAPVLIAVVLTDVAFGLVSRVVPQMNVFAVGFNVKIIVGVVVFAAALPFVGGWLADELHASVGQALQVLRVG